EIADCRAKLQKRVVLCGAHPVRTRIGNLDAVKPRVSVHRSGFALMVMRLENPAVILGNDLIEYVRVAPARVICAPPTNEIYGAVLVNVEMAQGAGESARTVIEERTLVRSVGAGVMHHKPVYRTPSGPTVAPVVC